MGYVTFLATLEIGDLAYGSRSASHNRVYSSFPFASRVILVTRVTRFSAITTPIRGHFFGPVSLLLACYSALPLGRSRLSRWNFCNYDFTLSSESYQRLVPEWRKCCINGQTNTICPLAPPHCNLTMLVHETVTPRSESCGFSLPPFRPSLAWP